MSYNQLIGSIRRMEDEDKREGFWGTDNVPLGHEEQWDGQPEFLWRLSMLEKRAEVVRYRGWSTCRLCGKSNGSETYHSHGWQWPSGFAHYVQDHNLMPTAEFMKMVTGATTVTPAEGG